MNFLCKLSKFRIIFFYAASLNLINLNTLKAQDKELGLAYFREITPFSSPDISRYNSIVQDSKGFYFIGGNNGLLRYDGRQWQQLNLAGPVTVCKCSDDKIIVYGKKYFGYIEYQADGNTHFTSLYQPENESSDSIGNINKIWTSNEYLVLQTSSGIFTWNNGKLTRINLPGLPGSVSCKDDSLLMYIPGKGLYFLVNNTFQTYKPWESLDEFYVIDIVNFNNQTLIYTKEKGLVFFHNGKMETFNPGINRYLAENGYREAIFDKKGNFICSTNKGSLVLYDQLNKTINYYHTREGLPGNNINCIYSDRSGNLWVLYDYGLYCIEWPSAFSFFDSRNGLHGIVKDITRLNGHIYVSTSKGIFVLQQEAEKYPENVKSIFKKIEKAGLDCGQLLNCGKILLAISENGILSISDDKTTEVYHGRVNTLFELKSHPGTVLAGTDNGIVSLDILSSKIICSPVAVNFTLPVMDFAETPDNVLWISCGSEGLFSLPLTGGLVDNIPFSRYDTTNGFPDKNNFIKMQEVDNKLIFFTDNGFYYFDNLMNKFNPYLHLINNGYKGNGVMVMPLLKDYENNLWLKVTRPGSYESEIWKACYCRTDSFEILPFSKRQIINDPVIAMYSEPDGVIWLGTRNNLIRYDTKLSSLSKHEISTHIYKIDIAGRDHIFPEPDIIKSDQVGSGPVNIRFSKNTIRFNYISTAYSGEGEGLFQYFLDGYDDTWSEWSRQNSCSYINLSPGTYTFNVRSQDIFGNISHPDKFIFHISLPVLSKWWAILIYIIIILTIILFLRKWKIYNDLQQRYKLEEIIQERTEALLKEKEKSENLLANILPKDTADELKLTGKATSSKFKMVTVLFADIQGFTKIAEQMNPEKLIDELDRFYFQFDTVVDKYNIEKIKTIGDAYMAAGGIPIKNRTNPVEVVLAALQMQQYMKDLKKTKTDIWDLRIGIHTGSVIAGVVGQKKLSYDIWGDTVNTASRMESSGEIGKVNISATTYELIKDFFKCHYRGKMPVKYKGDIEMYFVTGIRPELQSDNEVTPNEEFNIHLQGLRLLDLEEFIFQRLKNELPQTLYFHNAQHTSHVHYQSELLGRSENVTSAELLLIRTAALCHDLGYIYTVDGHEEKSVEIAREILPLYMYTGDQIEQICKLILATKMPPEPSNLMEKIIIDANFDHLGRVDFLIESDRLFQEYRAIGKASTKKEWNELQIDFLNNFDFFTSAAQKMREVSKEQQIENIIKFS
jgi:adenylate cyclase